MCFIVELRDSRPYPQKEAGFWFIEVFEGLSEFIVEGKKGAEPL